MQIVTGTALEFVVQVLRAESLFGSVYGFAVAFQPTAEDLNSSSCSWNFHTRDINDDAFRSYPRLHHVDRYVQKNHSEPMPLAKAARIAAMERTYFSAFFHREVGVTFTDWLQYVRIARSLSLLSSRDYSITEVAAQAGFESLRTFERTFRKWTSLTPQAFKKLASPC